MRNVLTNVLAKGREAGKSGQDHAARGPPPECGLHQAELDGGDGDSAGIVQL